VVNGSFESDVGLNSGQWDVFSPSIEGWTVSSGPGIEIQNGNVAGVMAYDGVQKVELDSHGSDSNSSMFQNVSLEAGSYIFSFAYMGRTGNPNTNGIEFSLLPSIGAESITGVRTDGWTVIERMFVLDAATDLTINFMAVGNDDTVGGFIDNVQISVVPLPPAALLFGGALAGLGWISRRRRKTMAGA
jgi:hypothetical protein